MPNTQIAAKARVPEVGTKVTISDHSGVICKAVVRRSGNTEIEIEDLEHHQKTEFALFESGWKMLFAGLGGERCFNRNAPSYTIEPVQARNKRSAPTRTR